ncbi:MAG: hypothetical protein R3E35_00550 [Rhodocyclaceae bacterium]|jgi:hypothetical protein
MTKTSLLPYREHEGTEFTEIGIPDCHENSAWLHAGPNLVMPAKAGIQSGRTSIQAICWIPAFAGMTMKRLHHGNGKQARARLNLLGNQDQLCIWFLCILHASVFAVVKALSPIYALR